MEDLSAERILHGTEGTRFREVEVHPSIDSTQRLLVSEGGPDGRVVVADHQTAGRGRQGRSWLDVPGAMLMFSALLEGIPPDEASLVSLAAGVAVARAVGDGARLKWPNDVRIGGRKVCGIIGELAASGNYVVVGIGVNVGHRSGELPDDLDATSIRIVRGDAPRRDDLCAAILHELDTVVGRDFMHDYRALSETIGADVRVELPDGSFTGRATAVRDDGALVVGDHVVMAGDVIHLR
jgi:BirA family biotin operon repressor/biotin-[acetyl-CoA-carboxylase] ligase